ncbi:MAG: TonB-dependent receptor plug domain-containing protein [Longimicrobiales bacterium]|nr:TonB-dependent receptor plug domain-containing protein [Longimicrobiales bacterium]
MIQMIPTPSTKLSRLPLLRPGVGVILFLLAWMTLPAPAEGQARGSLLGIVRDDVNGEAVGGATVTLVEVDRETRTDENGGFVFLELPVGPVTMRVDRAGYGTVVEEVQVQTGDLRTFEVFLPRLENMLQELLVPGERSRESAGHSRYEVRGGGDGRHRTALDLLVGRVPGLSIGSAPGNVGKGSQIRIRGVGTISGSNWPAIYLDGIRIDSRGPDASVTGNGYALTVLQTIPAEQVERIRILSGPAAASRYSEAANGVIVVETVRGSGDQDEDEGD